MTRQSTRFIQFLRNRFYQIPARDNYITRILITALLFSTTLTAIIEILGNPLSAKGFYRFLSVLLVSGINLIVFVLMTFLLGFIYTILYLPLPRLLLGSLTYAFVISIGALHIESSGTAFSFIVGTSYTVFALVCGGLYIFFRYGRVSWLKKGIVLIISLSTIPLYFYAQHLSYVPNDVAQPGKYNTQIPAPNPGKPGDYAYEFLTYGSGTDKQRRVFGRDVDEISPSVDASHFITSWRDSREKFWGFDQSHLPLNGRVFLPEGDGPFPVFLMVHGNHTMEYLSTAGYDYLGEHLASQGVLTISVDEDFINYSNRFKIPNNNYELRAWMMLQHINLLETMNDNPNSFLHNKVDLDNVALMGHSRGGQAVAMVADYETYFADEGFDAFMDNVTIQGVVAISPTEKSLDEPNANLHNTAYLAIHGARDADVTAFSGDQQFYRTTFDPDVESFKATVYLAEANHTQFNTDWGNMDLSLPRGLFLNKQETMSPDDQRQITKVYLGAFLSSVFKSPETYRPLFEDYRNGVEWLPETPLVTKYEHASYQRIVGFNKTSSNPVKVSGFKDWSIKTPTGRRNKNHPVDALALTWDEQAIYTAYIHDTLNQHPERLVLRLANRAHTDAFPSQPDIDLELKTTDGVKVRLPLETFMPIPEVIHTAYTPFGLADQLFREGRYDTSWEPVFQTIEVPLETFEAANPDFKREDVRRLALHFKESGGSIYLEQIGIW